MPGTHGVAQSLGPIVFGIARILRGKSYYDL
jgi:hypothetical protein